MSEASKRLTAYMMLGASIPSSECEDCGHRHTPNGCEGSPTASDLWAGVSPGACDCPGVTPPEA